MSDITYIYERFQTSRIASILYPIFKIAKWSLVPLAIWLGYIIITPGVPEPFQRDFYTNMSIQGQARVQGVIQKWKHLCPAYWEASWIEQRTTLRQAQFCDNIYKGDVAGYEWYTEDLMKRSHEMRIYMRENNLRLCFRNEKPFGNWFGLQTYCEKWDPVE